MGKRKILNISLPAELYSAVSSIADSENKSKAELAREIITEYLTKRERWLEIRQWGRETAREMKIESEDNLTEIIHDSRKANY